MGLQSFVLSDSIMFFAILLLLSFQVKSIHLVTLEELQLIHFVPHHFGLLYTWSGFVVLPDELFYYLLALQEDIINEIIFSIMHSIIYQFLECIRVYFIN